MQVEEIVGGIQVVDLELGVEDSLKKFPQVGLERLTRMIRSAL